MEPEHVFDAELPTALDAPPSSTILAVKLTAALSAMTVISSPFVVRADSISDALPPGPLLASGAIFAVVLAFLVLKRHNWARMALVTMATTTGLVALAYTFTTTGLVLAVVVPWLVGGAAVAVLLIMPETIEWIRPEPTQLVPHHVPLGGGWRSLDTLVFDEHGGSTLDAARSTLAYDTPGEPTSQSAMT